MTTTTEPTFRWRYPHDSAISLQVSFDLRPEDIFWVIFAMLEEWADDERADADAATISLQDVLDEATFLMEHAGRDWLTTYEPWCADAEAVGRRARSVFERLFPNVTLPTYY